MSQPHLLGGAGRADHLRGPEQPGHLAGEGADGSRSAGDEDDVALGQLRDPGQADVRREAGHAEDAEVGGGGHRGDVEPTGRGGRQHRVLAPARPCGAPCRRGRARRRCSPRPRRPHPPRAGRRAGRAARRTWCRSSGRACRGRPTAACCAPAPRRGPGRAAPSRRCGSRWPRARRGVGRSGGSHGWGWSWVDPASPPGSAEGCPTSQRHHRGISRSDRYSVSVVRTDDS